MMSLEGRPTTDGRVLPPFGRFACPSCKQEHGIALGGQGGAWFECRCGSYSPLEASWTEAFTAWTVAPQQIDTTLVMSPKIGCPEE